MHFFEKLSFAINGDQMYLQLMSKCSLSGAKFAVSAVCLVVCFGGCTVVDTVVEKTLEVGIKTAGLGLKATGAVIKGAVGGGAGSSTSSDDSDDYGTQDEHKEPKPEPFFDNFNTRKIKSAIAKQANDRKVNELDLITLDLSGKELTGINHLGSGNFSNLRSLDLSNNSIADLSPLYSLHGLRVLILNVNEGLSDDEISLANDRLGSCTIVCSADYSSPLLPSTTRKDKYFGWRLDNSQREILKLISKKVGKKTKEIVDSDLDKISSLDLSKTKVSDLESIQSLDNLKVLDISGTSVKSVESLDGVALKMLIAQDCSVQPWQLRNFSSGNPNCLIVHPEMADVAGSEVGRSEVGRSEVGRSEVGRSEINLDASDNRIIMRGVGERLGVAFLGHIERSDLEKVKRLYLADKNLRDISLLASMSDLEYLDLDNNMITDVSWLRSLINLKTLYLQNNNIRDITPLKGLASLKYLFLEGNPIDSRSIRMLKKALPNAVIVARHKTGLGQDPEVVALNIEPALAAFEEIKKPRDEKSDLSGKSGFFQSQVLAVRQAKESVWHVSREVNTLTGTDEFGRPFRNLTPEYLWLRVGEAKLNKLNWEKYWDADWKLKQGSFQEIRLKKQWQEMGRQARQAFLKRQGLPN